MNLAKIKSISLTVLSTIGAFAVAGLLLTYGNYQMEKQDVLPALERVEITSTSPSNNGLVRVTFVPLNGQTTFAFLPITGGEPMKVSHVWATVRPNDSLAPGAVGKLHMVQDAMPWRQAEFEFIPEQKRKF